ncbi:hypothetical protein PF327_10220 [Sulfurovum sp. XTW-4]|uniref:Uncharacterized protein n=1 Tax=Sulfurovum xiamenensis TaxID=3019066 RepID=A0ABT7QU10_9BACT|nr:hypothetical protein [Sulfurovum xiamenensis]MDM5264568.1 hypothetical protein [Sulfurovum xiamenensis]
MKLLQICVLCFMSITSLSAFTFDKWESGDELSGAIQTARINNVPLTIQTSGFFSENFDWRFLKNHQKYRTFYYRENLLGAQARVALHFTQGSKKLYKIVINWSGVSNKRAFEEQLYRLMDKKYGKRNIVAPSSVGEYVFFKKRAWKIDNNSVLQSNSFSGGIELVYLDKKYEFDDIQTKQKKKLDIIVRDAGKF